MYYRAFYGKFGKLGTNLIFTSASYFKKCFLLLFYFYRVVVYSYKCVLLQHPVPVQSGNSTHPKAQQSSEQCDPPPSPESHL